MPMYTFMARVGKDYNLNPPYQRGSVWTTEMRVALIKSLLLGLPMGIIYLNARPISKGGDLRYQVVDGKQRIETLLAFMRDEFSIPADWLETHFWDYPKGVPEHEHHKHEKTRRVDLVREECWGKERLVWSDLTDVGRRRFQHMPIAVYETYFQTEEEEAALYELLNFQTIRQTEEDRARAQRVSKGTELKGGMDRVR